MYKLIHITPCISLLRKQYQSEGQKHEPDIGRVSSRNFYLRIKCRTLFFVCEQITTTRKNAVQFKYQLKMCLHPQKTKSK